MTMRVLLISGAFPPMRAGEATHAFHLAKHLAGHKGMEVQVLTSQENTGGRDSSFQVHSIMQQWSWSELPRLIKFLKNCSPDAILLMHIDFVYHDHPMITFAPTITKTLFPSVPFVTQFENPIGIPPKPFPLGPRLLRKGFEQWAGKKDVEYRFGTLLRDSRHLIVLSKRHWVALTELFPAAQNKMVLIPPPPIIPIYPEQNGTLRQRGRDLLGAERHDFLIIYFGYIYPNKGVETLLKAFQIVSHQMSNVRLILAGGILDREYADRPYYAQELRELPKQLGIEDRVTWTGELPWDSDRVSLYFHASDVCVLPFDTGVQLNNSSFAAAAIHGIPVITTQSTMSESVFIHQHNVMLCPPKSPEAMAEALKMVIDQPDLREQLRRGALQLAQEWFSWDKAIERTLATFT